MQNPGAAALRKLDEEEEEEQRFRLNYDIYHKYLADQDFSWIEATSTYQIGKKTNDDLYKARPYYLAAHLKLPVKGRYVYDYMTKRAYLLINDLNSFNMRYNYFAFKSSNCIYLVKCTKTERLYMGAIAEKQKCYILVTTQDNVEYENPFFNSYYTYHTEGVSSEESFMSLSPAIFKPQGRKEPSTVTDNSGTASSWTAVSPADADIGGADDEEYPSIVTLGDIMANTKQKQRRPKGRNKDKEETD